MQKLSFSPTLTLPTLLTLCLFALLGCDKKEPTSKTEPSTSNTSTTVTTSPIVVSSSVFVTPPISAAQSTPIPQSTTVSSLSPTLEYWVSYTRVSAIQLLMQKYPNMTPEQKACLASHEGDMSYSKQLQPFMATILTPSETVESDKFFASALGKKFAIMSKAQIDASTAMPEVSDAETDAIMAEFQKPYMIKLQKQTANADPQTAKDMLIKSTVTEQTRCKIS